MVPHLTRFTGPHCAGPLPQRSLPAAHTSRNPLGEDFRPARAGCRYREPLAPHLARLVSSVISHASQVCNGKIPRCRQAGNRVEKMRRRGGRDAEESAARVTVSLLEHLRERFVSVTRLMPGQVLRASLRLSRPTASFFTLPVVADQARRSVELCGIGFRLNRRMPARRVRHPKPRGPS